MQNRKIRNDTGNQPYIRRGMRIISNSYHTVPITLLAMMGAEMLGTSPTLIWAGGVTLLVGCLWHYYVIRTVGWSNGRAASMTLTFIAMGGFALAILWQVYS